MDTTELYAYEVREAIDEVFKTAIICAGNDTKTVRLLEGVKGYLLYKLENVK